MGITKIAAQNLRYVWENYKLHETKTLAFNLLRIYLLCPSSKLRCKNKARRYTMNLFFAE